MVYFWYMNISKCTVSRGVGLLLSRLIIGGIFITGGWMKVSAMTATVAMFATMGIPTFLTYIVSYGELVGGILLVLGLCVRKVSLFLAVIMIVAVYLTRSAGLMGFGFPLSVLAALLTLCGCGGGKFSCSRNTEFPIGNQSI